MKVKAVSDGEDITIDRLLLVLDDLPADKEEVLAYPSAVREALLMAAERIVSGTATDDEMRLYARN